MKWATPGMLQNQAIIAVTNLNLTLLANVDFDSLGAFERVKLLRIKGWLSLAPDITPGVTAGVFMAILKVPAGITVPDPSSGNTFDLADLLWAGGAQFGLAAAAAGQGPTFFDVDVKVQRNLDPEDRIVFAARCSGATDAARVSGMLRALWTYK